MPSEQESTSSPELQPENSENSQIEAGNSLALERIELYQKKVEQFAELSDPDELYNTAENLIDDFKEIRQGVDERTSRRIFLRIYTTLKEASSARGFSTFEELDLAAQLARLRRKAPDLVDLAEEAVAIRNGNKDSGFEENENKILEEESKDRSKESIRPSERYYQDVEEVCAELVEIIEKGEAELAAKKLKPFEARVDGKSYYQELLQQEEIVRMVRDKVLENINSDTSLQSKEAAHLKLGIEDLAAGVLGKAHLFRQETLIPNYFNFDHINYIVDTILKNEDYVRGRVNPREANLGGAKRDLIDVFEKIVTLLETGLSFDLAEEDEKLVKEKLTEVRTIYQDLKQAEQYHRDLVDFENNPQNKAARQLSEVLVERRREIEPQGAEQRAQIKLSWPKTRLEQLANHQRRLDDRIKALDDKSVVKEEATRLLEEVVSARQAANEIYELIERAQLTVYEQHKEIVDLVDKTREILAEDVEAVRGDKNQTSRLETLQKELQAAEQAAQAVNLLSDADAAGYEGNEKVNIRIKELNDRLLAARKHIQQAIEASRKDSEKEISEAKFQKFVRRVRSEIGIQINEPEAITPDNDWVGNLFSTYYDKIEQFKQAPELRDQAEKFDIELKRQQFKAYRAVMLSMLDRIHVNGSDDMGHIRANVFQAIILPNMSQIVDRLKSSSLDKGVLNLYKQELEDVGDRMTAFAFLHFSWRKTYGQLIGNGARREPPGELNFEEDYPLRGVDFQNLINRSYDNPEFDKGYNPTLNPNAKIKVPSPFDLGGEYELQYKETAASWCMNKFDEIFRWIDPNAKREDGSMILSSNLHASEDALVDYVYDELMKHIDSLNISDAEKARKKAMAPKTLVSRTYQTSIELTGHHSYLAKDSARGMSDKLYYMFHLLEYAIKYGKAGTTDINLAQLMSIFSIEDPDTGKVVSPIREVYPPNRIRRVENKLKDIGAWDPKSEKVRKELFELFGFENLRFLMEPFVVIPNVARGEEPVVKIDDAGRGYYVDEQGRRVASKDQAKKIKARNTPVFTSFLRAQPLKANPSALAQSRLELDGDKESLVPVRFPKRSARDQFNPTYTIDDLKSVEDGRIPYSAVEWSQFGQAIREHWNNLANNTRWLMDLFLSSEDDFIAQTGDLAKLGGTENKVKYAASTVPKMAPEIVARRKKIHPEEGWEASFGDITTYGITVRLIVARGLLMMNQTGPESVDAPDKFNTYLNQIVGKKIFGDLSEETVDLLIEGIKVVVTEGEGLRKAFQRAGYEFRNQIQRYLEVT